jgi:hypothetical protein
MLNKRSGITVSSNKATNSVLNLDGHFFSPYFLYRHYTRKSLAVNSVRMFFFRFFRFCPKSLYDKGLRHKRRRGFLLSPYCVRV